MSFVWQDRSRRISCWVMNLYWVLSGHTFGCLLLRKNQQNHEIHISTCFGSYLAKWIYWMHVCERWVFWSVSNEQVKKQSSSHFGDLSPVHEFHLHYLFFCFCFEPNAANGFTPTFSSWITYMWGGFWISSSRTINTHMSCLELIMHLEREVLVRWFRVYTRALYGVQHVEAWSVAG